MSTKDIIVIGSSAGGVDALMRLCAGLPAALPATIFIAQHLSPSSRSVLPRLLERAGRLPVVAPVDGQPFERNHIYVAGPDHHMLLRSGKILLRRGPYENRMRPAVNALFRSAALSYGSRVVGVVLTGLLDDGTDGLIAIKAAGGTSIAQDPDDAEWPSMPRNAVKRDHVDRIVRLSELPAVLAEVAQEEAGPSVPLPEEYNIEDLIAAQEIAVMEPHIKSPGHPSFLACPDCGGVLNQIQTGEELRFRCQVGHAFTPLGLADAQNAELEHALGVAARTHRDRMKLFAQMAENARRRNLPHVVGRWERASEESEQMVGVLEQAMTALRKPLIDGEG